jgi:hypothetical protein
MSKTSPKATAKGKQPRPKVSPEGPSTMARIAGGKEVESLARRVRKRGAAKGYPKGW